MKTTQLASDCSDAFGLLHVSMCTGGVLRLGLVVVPTGCGSSWLWFSLLLVLTGSGSGSGSNRLWFSLVVVLSDSGSNRFCVVF